MLIQDLTDEQLADIATYDTYARGLLSTLMKVYRDSDAQTMSLWALSNVSPNIESLNDGEIITNSTGLAGAKSLTKEEFAQMMTLLKSLSDIAVSNISLIVKAIGINSE